MHAGGRIGRILIGLLVLALGVIFLVEGLTSWDFPFGVLWPVILLAFGLASLLRRGGPRWLGGVMVVLGGVSLLDVLGVWSYGIGDVWRLWPVILILVGGRIIFGRKRKQARSSSPTPSATTSTSDGSEEVEINSVFASTEKRITGSSFSGGRITAVFGGAELDLRGVSASAGEATIDATALFGGIELRVPSGWTVDLRTTNILGGVQDARSDDRTTETGNRLVITGLCMFGGIEIKS